MTEIIELLGKVVKTAIINVLHKGILRTEMEDKKRHNKFMEMNNTITEMKNTLMRLTED